MRNRDASCRRHGRRARGAQRVAGAVAGAAAAAVLLTLPALTRAGDLWDGGGGSNDWTTNNNWSPNGEPANDGTAPISFGGTVRLTPNLNNNWSIASLTFLNTAGAFTLGSSNNSLLTIGAGGIAQNDTDTQTINHRIALGAAQTWDLAAGDLTVGGAISGAGALTLTGGGTLTLAGSAASTYTGATTVTDGTLVLGKNAGVNAIAGTLIIGDSSTATVLAEVIQLANDQIANGAAVTVRRSGLYNLANGNRSETIAALTLEDGTVTTGTGTLTVAGNITSNNVTPGAVSTISGNLALGGATRTITSGANNTLNLDAVVANGGILLQGDGTLNVTGANTFTGGFQHGGGGTVNIGNDAAFGAGSVTAAAGATRIFSVTGGDKALANSFVLNGATQFTLPANLTLNGNLSGAGALTKDGAGNLTLGGSGSTYTGATTVSAGKLIVTANNALGATSAGTTIGPGAGLELANVNYAAAEPLTLNSFGLTDTLAGTSGNSTWAGAITLADHARFVSSGGTLTILGPVNAGNFNVYLDGDSASTYSGNITGTALTSLLKQGAGTATLTGTNTVAAVILSGGTLRLASPGGTAIPDSTGISISSGATLHFATSETIGSISGSAGTISLSPGAGVTATVGGGSFGGAIMGNAAIFTKTTPATLTLAGSVPNGFTGTTQVLEGTLHLNKSVANGAVAGALEIGTNSASPAAIVTLGASEQISNASAVTVRRSGLLDLASGNRSESIGGLTLVDGTVVTGIGTLTMFGTLASSNATPGAVSTISGNLNLGAAPRTVTSGPGNTLTIDAVISNGGMVLQGDGALNLTGANTFALGFEHGGGGRVNIGSNTALGTGTVTVTPVVTRVFSVINGPKTLANNFQFNSPAHFALPDNLTLTGNISGGGAISKDGVGDLILGGSGSAFGGALSINEGKLIVTANNALGAATGGTSLAIGTVLELPGVDYAAAEPLTINGGGGPGGTNPSMITTGGAASTFAGPITLTSHSGISAANGPLTVSGAINLAGWNLLLDGASDSTYSGAIGGGLAVNKAGGGTVTLSGTNTFSALGVTAGTVRLAGAANNALADTASVTIAPGATLEVAANENIDLLNGQPTGNGSIVINPGVGFGVRQGSWSGVISGGGTLNKIVDGTLTLSGANTFTGGLAIQGGTARLEGGAAVADTAAVSIVSGTLDVPVSETIAGLSGGGGVTIGSGAVLTVTGGGNFAGVISGAGELAKGSGADLLLRGNNTYTGRTTINAGTIDVVADASLGAVPVGFVDNQLALDNGGTLRIGEPDATNAVTISPNRGITIGANGGRLQPGNGDTLTVASKITGGGNLAIATAGGVSPTMPLVTLSGTNTTFSGKTIIDGVILAIAGDANLSAAPGAPVADMLTLANGGTLRATSTMSLPANRGVTLLNGGGGGGGALEVNSGQTLTTLGPISGAGALTKRGSGTLNFGTTAHGFAGRTTIDAGTVIAQQDANFGAPPLALVPDQLTINQATLRWTANGADIVATRGVRLGMSSSQINVDAGVTMNVNSPVSGPGGLTKTGSGTLNLLASNSYAGATSVGGGRMIINQSFVTNTSFAISAGAVVELAEAPAVTLKTTSVIGPGRLDVKDNKVIITSQPLGTWNASTSSYGGVTGMIASAYNFSAWTGNGLTTSMPAASVDGITTLAVSTAEAVFLDQFGGVSVAPSNVLVMYTYAGDTNLDGLVDAADYGAIDNWVQFPGTSGYANGDFNFDGVIDAADYGIIDNTIQLQGAPFPVNLPPSAAAAAPAVPAGASALSGVTAVPEPSACGLAIFAAAAALLPRRRRQ